MSRSAKRPSHHLPANAFDAPPGLPAALPAGEHILWQGRPCGFGIAFRALHLRLVGIWFAGLALWAALPPALAGRWIEAGTLAAPTLGVGAGALALLSLLGWLSARTTAYTITNRRVVMRVGIALPMTLNLPFALVEAAECALHPDGSADLPLRLRAGNRVAYLHLWPHARPWRVNRPEPMLRAIPDGRAVAEILARALTAHRALPEEVAGPVVLRPRAAPAPRLATAS
ncbi:photosynthetic complex putative assembly protein PuhB [Methylobacterium sp. J-068]|uniref:photosynthetic complex putative assembly protein PuhB n=1 Tax=Methylobacterium sp. J-068 TaxID=2836649 RepID=UPI001FBB29D2|nr:photosynthetic complex putative assembly protein PuhB [Methylobacterium sp. J-068]MCJ2034281.1 PH domain-containing protein [Methylobacterium sp. J-068]